MSGWRVSIRSAVDIVGAKACFLSRPVPIGSLMVEVYNDIMDPTTRRRQERRLKSEFAFFQFSLCSDYSYPLTLSIVGKPSWSWI